MIHPTAIIRSGAKLDPSVEVGPYAVIDEGVEIAAGCVLGPHVHITGRTVLGQENRLHAGCVLGDAPQDLKFAGGQTGLVIGARNIFREGVTVHRSNSMAEDTIIGSDNFFMANSHVGHNCRLGSGVIMANGALLGGHVWVGDRAFVSGNCLVHQFVRVGTLAIMQGGSAVSKDLPPYTVARGHNGICGLNQVGLRRAGMPPDQRLELKKVYALLFRSRVSLVSALAEAKQRFTSAPARTLIEFVAASKRGVCADVSLRAGPCLDPEAEGNPEPEP